MTPTATIRESALAREYLALALETEIAEVGRALRAYERETTTLSEHTGVDLATAIEPLIIRHLAKAGLTRFLERKLVDTPAALLEAVERQHGEALGLAPSGDQP